MTEKEFDRMISELRELSFEVDIGDYYCDSCLEFDDVIEVLNKWLKDNRTRVSSTGGMKSGIR